VQFLTGVKQQVEEFVSENATTLLTAGGVIGTVATAVLAGRGGLKYERLVYDKAIDTSVNEPDKSLDDIMAEMPKLDKLKMAAPHIIPPIITGSATIAMIIFSHKMSSAKIAGLAAAYGLAERNFGEYKEKVAQKITGPKQTQIDDELAQEKLDRTPGHDNIVIVDGEILCFDKSGGRYFRSTVEAIKQAVNTANAEIINHGFVTASPFYKEVNLPANAWSDDVDFDMSNMIELTYSTGMVGGNRTCFVFEFKNLPKTEYGPKYE